MAQNPNREPFKVSAQSVAIGGLAVAFLGFALAIDGSAGTHFSGNLLPEAVRPYEFPVGVGLGFTGSGVGLVAAIRNVLTTTPR